MDRAQGLVEISMCWVKIVKQGLEEREEEKAGGGWGEIHVISGQL